MKKILFWLCYIPMGVIFLVLGGFATAFEMFEEGTYHFENWCFDRPEDVPFKDEK